RKTTDGARHARAERRVRRPIEFVVRALVRAVDKVAEAARRAADDAQLQLLWWNALELLTGHDIRRRRVERERVVDRVGDAHAVRAAPRDPLPQRFVDAQLHTLILDVAQVLQEEERAARIGCEEDRIAQIRAIEVEHAMRRERAIAETALVPE